jgi:hypothetical protein
MDAIKLLTVVALVAIVASLGKALFHLSSGDTDLERSAQMLRALTVRIALSIALFLLLMLGWYFGGISPHGMG